MRGAGERNSAWRRLLDGPLDRLLFGLLPAAALACLACRPSDPALAGGGSDTELSGSVVAMAGSSPEGVSVRLVPAVHNPLEENAYLAVRSVMTGDSGRYRFPDVGPGTYRIEAVHPTDGSRLAIRDIRKGGHDLRVPADTLREPGTLVLRLAEDETRAGGFAYIPGSTYFRSVEPEAAIQVMDSLPAGTEEIIYLSRGGHLEDTVALARSVRVPSGDTLRAGAYAAWARSLRLRVDAAAAGLSGDLAAFPLLLRLNGEDLDFGGAGPAGGDIRFAKEDGTPLPFEIEAWDATARNAVIWVRLDTLPAGRTLDFRMHWDNPSAKPAGRGSAVFDTGGAYGGVWHFGGGRDPGAGAAPSLLDASYQANHGEFLGPAPGAIPAGSAVPGPVAGALRLDGTSQSITTTRAFASPAELSLSLWFRTTTTRGGKLLGFGNARVDSSRDFDRHFWMGDDGRVHFGIFQDWKVPRIPADTTLVLSSPGALNDGEWHFLAATVSAAGTRLSVDGRESGFLPGANRPAVFTGYWRMGFDGMNTLWPFYPASMHFAGDLDEVRVSHREFSPDWFRFAYENMRPGSRTVAPAP